jgi:hypothetical protein
MARGHATLTIAPAPLVEALQVTLVLIAAHSRPFIGEFSVSPSALLQVLPGGHPVPSRALGMAVNKLG